MVITFPLVLFLLLNFILLYLFLKTVDKRKWLVALVSMVLTPLVYFYVFYPFLNIISSYHHQKYFNADNWKAKPALRYEMIDQMKASEALLGVSKAEAKLLLGKPEWYSWDERRKQNDSSQWNYGLGIKPGALNKEKLNALIVFKNGYVSDISCYEELISYETLNDE